MLERTFIRILVVALCLALFAFVLAPVPVNLPAPAFEQKGLYRLEVALLTFYGVLLLVTPVLAGLVRGRLPTEISTRGAKFAEQADQLAAQDEVAIKRLEATTDRLALKLAGAHTEIERLDELVRQ